jgi:hypothetical protein
MRQADQAAVKIASAGNASLMNCMDKAEKAIKTLLCKLVCNFAPVANVSDLVIRSLKICSSLGGSQAGPGPCQTGGFPRPQRGFSLKKP